MADEFSDKDIQQAIDGWRSSVTESAERPDWFWSRQRTHVMSQIREQRGTSMPKLAWASIAVTLIMPTRTEKQIAPQVKAQQQVQMSDHDLMLAIERSMNAGGPSSLA